MATNNNFINWLYSTFVFLRFACRYGFDFARKKESPTRRILRSETFILPPFVVATKNPTPTYLVHFLHLVAMVLGGYFMAQWQIGLWYKISLLSVVCFTSFIPAYFLFIKRGTSLPLE